MIIPYNSYPSPPSPASTVLLSSNVYSPSWIVGIKTSPINRLEKGANPQRQYDGISLCYYKRPAA